MAKIYLINVGANTGHASLARAPLFPDGSFEFVSFPDDGSEIPYSREAWPYVSDSKMLKTHADPDWQRLTYGDNCANRRAMALLSAEPGDMLLFWGLFWQIAQRGKGVFECGGEDRRWCLFGALTVKYIIKAEAGVDVAVRARMKDRDDQRRALRNAHVRNGCLPRIKKGRHDVLFVGDPNRSARFDRAVDLEVYQDNGLLRRTILSSDGRALNWSQRPRWGTVHFAHVALCWTTQIEGMLNALRSCENRSSQPIPVSAGSGHNPPPNASPSSVRMTKGGSC